MSRLVVVKTYSTRLEAELAGGYLESNGIEAFYTGGEGGAYPYPILPSTGVSIFVTKKDFEKAVKLLEKAK